LEKECKVAVGDNSAASGRSVDASLEDEELGCLFIAKFLVERCMALTEIDGAGVMLVTNEGDLRMTAASNPSQEWLGRLELEHEQGPGWDCLRSGSTVAVADLETDGSRWPSFATAAVQAGVRTVQAFPLQRRGDVLGVLELVTVTAKPLGGQCRGAVQALADLAALSLWHQRALLRQQNLTDQLQEALSSRVVIEQAKGALVARAGLTMQDAFDTLRQHARANNLRITDVARAIIDIAAEGHAERSSGRPVPRPPHSINPRVRAALRALIHRKPPGDSGRI
jgi:hypothetical protein